jgi:hypothetical protein
MGKGQGLPSSKLMVWLISFIAKTQNSQLKKDYSGEVELNCQPLRIYDALGIKKVQSNSIH